MNFSILKAVWGKQTGYVFIPRRKKSDTGESKWVEGKGYRYPSEWGAIKATIEKYAKDGYDTYWCPQVFKSPSRLKENVVDKLPIFWADLDPIDPATLGELRPSIAWKSSEGRYQALWFTSKWEDTSEVERVNKQLSYAIGADKGGWDLTQVLRVPGSPNYKYDPPQKGELLWAENVRFDLKRVDELTKGKVSEKTEEPLATNLEALLKGWEIPKRTRELLFVDKREVEVGDRSDRLWEIETSLIESGLPILTAVNIVSLCPWNKFKGRKGEKEQIYNEVLKADEYVKRKGIKEDSIDISTTEIEMDEHEKEMWAIPFARFASTEIEPPEWLVEGIWQKGTYGMIAGEPKTYKSVQATDLALSVASGKPFLNAFPVKATGTVLYIQEENNPQTVLDRVFKIAAAKGLLTSTGSGWALPDDLPVHFSNNFGIDLTSKESRLLVEKTVHDLKPVLVIFDPLYMMMGGVDENSATEVNSILKWLTRLRNVYNVSILLCHHYNKGNGSTRGGQRVRGTSAFHAWVESALYVKVTPEQYTVDVEREFRAFPSLPELRVKLELGMPGELYYNPQLIEVGEKKPMSVKVEDICTALSTSPRTLDDLAGYTKLGRTETRELVDKLVSEGVVMKVEGGGRGKRATYILR